MPTCLLVRTMERYCGEERERVKGGKLPSKIARCSIEDRIKAVETGMNKWFSVQDNPACMPVIFAAALRFCRRIVGLKEESYNQYIVKNNLLAPVVKAFLANGRKYNLLNSAIIEMFEFIKSVSHSM